MESQRFDNLTRALAAPRSRRGFLVTLAASVGAAWTGADSSAAPKADRPSKCYGGGSHCTNGKQCCSGICTNRQCVPINLCADLVCDDSNECTQNGCVDGECVYTPIDCGNDTECVSHVCDPVYGCDQIIHEGAPCGDGSVCTEYGTCPSSTCISGNDFDPECPPDCEGNSVCAGCCSGYCAVTTIAGTTFKVCQPEST